MRNNLVETAAHSRVEKLSDAVPISATSILEKSRASNAIPVSFLLSTLGVLLTAIIYFIGAQFSYGYFGWFHINADRFPRDRTQTMLDGIKAIFTFCTDVLGFYDRQWLMLPVVFLTMFITIVVYAGLVRLVAWLARRQRLRSERLTRWGRIMVLLSIWPFTTVYFLFALPFLTSLLISLPAAVGERAGRIVAEGVADEIRRCPHELSGSLSYVQVKDGETIKAQGFLLAATHERVALMDRGVPLEYATKDFQLDYMTGDPRPSRVPQHPTLKVDRMHCGRAAV